MDKDVNYQDCVEEITYLVKSLVPIIWVTTHEEERLINDLEELLVKKFTKSLWSWSSWRGLINYNSSEYTKFTQAKGENDGTNNPIKALKRIIEIKPDKNTTGTCFVLKDFNGVLVPAIQRQIRDMYPFLIDQNKTLIIVSPTLSHGEGCKQSGIPVSLEKQIAVVEYGLPNLQRIRQIIHQAIQEMEESDEEYKKNVKLTYTEQEVTEYAKALQGLTQLEIETSIATCVTYLKELNVKKLLQDKKQLLRKSQILEFIESSTDITDVGGLDQAKKYLSKYALANTEEAQKYGVEPLKGVLLVGIPGAGKSLLAKAVSNMWKLPLLRLDVGRVMSSLVGSSEAKMREVISQSEAMAPNIIWLDEVEKSLSGTKSSNMSDGGTLARVFGTLLTAIEEGMDGCTLIATANDISMLPPEFIRRFNEVFFVDLPGPDERWDIFSIHLRKRNRNPDNFVQFKDELVEASKEYTGAEIEKAIKDSIAAAFYAGEKDINHQFILKALADTKPISKTMAEKIQTIRDQAKGNYRFASSWSEDQLVSQESETPAVTAVKKIKKTNARFKNLNS